MTHSQRQAEEHDQVLYLKKQIGICAESLQFSRIHHNYTILSTVAIISMVLSFERQFNCSVNMSSVRTGQSVNMSNVTTGQSLLTSYIAQQQQRNRIKTSDTEVKGKNIIHHQQVKLNCSVTLSTTYGALIQGQTQPQPSARSPRFKMMGFEQ